MKAKTDHTLQASFRRTAIYPGFAPLLWAVVVCAVMLVAIRPQVFFYVSRITINNESLVIYAKLGDVFNFKNIDIFRLPVYCYAGMTKFQFGQEFWLQRQRNGNCTPWSNKNRVPFCISVGKTEPFWKPAKPLTICYYYLGSSRCCLPGIGDLSHHCHRPRYVLSSFMISCRYLRSVIKQKCSLTSIKGLPCEIGIISGCHQKEKGYGYSYPFHFKLKFFEYMPKSRLLGGWSLIVISFILGIFGLLVGGSCDGSGLRLLIAFFMVFVSFVLFQYGFILINPR